MYIYGKNAVIEALKSDFQVVELLIKEDIVRDLKVNQILSLAEEKGIKVSFVDKYKLAIKVNSQENQGVGASIDFKLHTLKTIFSKPGNLNKSFIYISEALDEHNVGAIIRTAECAGFGGVIIPNDINITPTVVKTSAGAALHIPIANLAIYQAIKEFQAESFEIIGIERGGQNLYKTKMNQPALLVIGGEDKSLSENIQERCNKVVEIPQAGEVNSLNMSVAAAIVMYEHIRQLNN